MDYIEVMKQFFEVGFKQGYLEKIMGVSKGKFSEIFRGRSTISKTLVQQTLEALYIVRDNVTGTINKLEELNMSNELQTYIVYEFTFPNGKKYYGRTYNLEARWQGGRGYKTQKVGKAIEEFGWENVEKRIIAENLTKENAEKIEHSLIKGTNSDLELLGYNEY